MGHYFLDTQYLQIEMLRRYLRSCTFKLLVDGFTIFSQVVETQNCIRQHNAKQQRISHTVKYKLNFRPYQAFTIITGNVSLSKKSENKLLPGLYENNAAMVLFLRLCWFSIALPHQSTVFETRNIFPQED